MTQHTPGPQQTCEKREGRNMGSKYTLREAIALIYDVYMHGGIPLQEHIDILREALEREE